MVVRKLLLLLMVIPMTLVSATHPPHSGAQVGPNDMWAVWGGQLELHFNTDLFRDHGFHVQTGKSTSPDGRYQLPLRTQSSLSIWAPKSAFDGYADGQLTTSGTMTLVHGEQSIDLSNFSIRPRPSNNLELDVINQSGDVVFHLTHVHSKVNQADALLTLKNMDINLSSFAAERLGVQRFDGLGLGVAYLTSNLQLPQGIQNLKNRGGCTPTNAQWHDGVNFLTDVALVNMSTVQQVNSIGSMIAIAPSATLENVGTADVPWYDKFVTGVGGTFPEPYDMDQHPFLIWNMYRLVDGELEQLGASGLKHAFFTVNTSCSCPGGSILWADNSPVNSGACRDTYGVGNNNSTSAVGIREEVDAANGLFEQCGSIFAPNGSAPGPCAEENFSIPFGTLERRLYVDNSDFNTPGAEYFLEGWYVIRDDINIYNSMGYQRVNPTGSGSSWTFGFVGGFIEGPAVNNWVDPNSPGKMETSEEIANASGHIQVISRVTDLGGGQFRYTYGIMNHDYSTGISELSLPGATSTSSEFNDPDYDGSNDWSLTTGQSGLSWAPPTVDDFQPWGTLYTFAIESSDPPQSIQVTLTDTNGVSYSVNAFGPVETPLFEDGFED